MSSVPRVTHVAHRMEGLTSHAFLVSVTGTRTAAILRLACVITVHTTPQVILAERAYNFVARAARISREDRKRAAISLWS